jgi:hypothetical protein
MAALLLGAAPGAHPSGAQIVAHSGADAHTIALWLFDEVPYGNVTLTDAGPHQIDLRLETGTGTLPLAIRQGTRGLVKGRFGSALHLPVGEGVGVTWPRGDWTRYGSAPLFTRGNEVPELCNLGYFDWTLELWYKASGAQPGRGVLLDLRNESGEASPQCPAGVNDLVLEAGRERFVLVSRLLTKREWDLEIPIPTDPARLKDGEWHHLAFTFTAAERQIRHYVDGRHQPLPKKGGFLPLMGQLVSLRLGRDLEGAQELAGLLDEVRLSDTVRYTADFAPPGSLSVNYDARALRPSRPNGPPLLFGPEAPVGPVALGSRKHLFIDDVLIARRENVRLVVNPPISKQATDFRSDQAWEPTPRFGAGLPDLASVWDEGDEIRLLYTNGGMWGGKPHAVGLATSRDGLHWTKPDLGLFTWEGSRRNNIVLRNASQGTAFKDLNPDVQPEHRYKYVAWCMNRGFYVFTSPDGVHWRRNETMALPFDPDGSISAYWDDQSGVYRGYLRALMPGAVRRRVVRVSTNEILKPWPFEPSPTPEWDGNWDLPKPTSGELPLIDTGGQIYRFKGIKYPWAPDVYLAFPWRFLPEGNIRPGSFLMVSRDGENWRRYEPPYYLSPGWELDGRAVLEALMEQGMIRRGDDIWQYGTVRFTEHGGALYGGVEHEGGYGDRLLRLVQRLDGFVSLDAGDPVGTVVTRPLVFEGRRLVLNVAAEGSLSVGLLDEAGNPIPGFTVAECDPISVDSTRKMVSWRGNDDLRRLAGKVVRLQLRMQKAKLFALQFISGDSGSQENDLSPL